GDADFTLSEKINTTVCRDPNSTSIPSVTGVPRFLFRNTSQVITKDPDQSIANKQIKSKSKKKKNDKNQSNKQSNQGQSNQKQSIKSSQNTENALQKSNIELNGNSSLSAPRNVIHSELKNLRQSNPKSANSTPKKQDFSFLMIIFIYRIQTLFHKIHMLFILCIYFLTKKMLMLNH
ncbi:hypothetical protein, partial [Helicobacter typhlonius]|uniref:hypothetical protein n=1 Tax=Helicobacter typhlonius TaxID=76936 RepID=UPI002FE26738